MNVQHRYVNVVEKFRVKLDRVTRREEHHYFLTQVLLEECEQQEKALLRWTHHVPLHQHKMSTMTQVSIA